MLKRLLLVYIALFLVVACSTVPTPTPAVTVSTVHLPANTPNETLGERIVKSASLQMGIPYKFGGNSPKEGFDCSGLAMYSHSINGISIPRQTREQFKLGKHIDRTALNAGDLLFFRTIGQSVSHVGIYIENDTFIHAPNSRKNVQIDSLDNSYYKKRYLGARRYW